MEGKEDALVCVPPLTNSQKFERNRNLISRTLTPLFLIYTALILSPRRLRV